MFTVCTISMTIIFRKCAKYVYSGTRLTAPFMFHLNLTIRKIVRIITIRNNSIVPISFLKFMVKYCCTEWTKFNFPIVRCQSFFTMTTQHLATKFKPYRSFNFTTPFMFHFLNIAPQLGQNLRNLS